MIIIPTIKISEEYTISPVEHSLELINHGSWGYLKDVESTFTVLDNQWAKGCNHVWFGDKLIENVDAKTFHINASGVAVDKEQCLYPRLFRVAARTVPT